MTIKTMLRTILIMCTIAITTLVYTITVTSTDNERITILLDNGGVVFNTDTLAAFKELGPLHIARYAFILKKNPLHISEHIRKRFFDFLDLIIQTHNILVPTITNDLPRDEKNNTLPVIMHKWLDGTMPCKHIRALARRTIAQNPTWFIHDVEKKLIFNMIRMVFTPEILVKTRKLSPHALAFIKECKKQGLDVYMISNWDKESFPLLQKRYPELFSLFDGIIISGDVMTVKPEEKIYQLILEKYNINPRTCFFFDDQKENINAARKLGINAILHTHPSVLTLDQLSEIGTNPA